MNITLDRIIFGTQHVAHKSVQPLKAIKTSGKIFRAATDIAEKFQKLSKPLVNAKLASKAPDLLLTPLNVKDAVSNVRKIFAPSQNPLDRMHALFATIIRLDSIVNAAATICKIVRVAVGPTAEKAVRWIPILNFVGLAVSLLSLELSSYSTHQARRLFEGFNNALKECMSTEDQTRKAEALKKALAIIEKEGITPLSKQLMISKKALETLTSRIDLLKSHIASKTIDEGDKDLVRTLTGRAKTQLSLKAADISSEVIAIVGNTLLLTPVPIAGQVAALSLLAISGTISLISWGTKFFLINKNPFDPNSYNRAQQIHRAFSQAIDTIQLSLLSFGKRVAHQLQPLPNA